MKKRILLISTVLISILTYSQAILPTNWSFQTTNLPVGWTESGTSFYTASGNTPPAMKFDNTGDYMIINLNSTPGDLTYYLTGNGFSGGGVFTVEESDLGSVWTTLHSHTTPPNASYTMYTDTPQSTTRFIRFIYTDKVNGNIGLDDVSVDIAPQGTRSRNPAFDVTPARLVSGLITEHGVFDANYKSLQNLRIISEGNQ